MQRIVLILLTLLTLAGGSRDGWAQEAAGVGRNVTIAVGQSQPPYFIPNEARGIEYDIIKEAFAYKGRTLQALYVPNPRILTLIEEKSADAGANIRPGMGFDTYLSDKVISFMNVMVTSADRDLELDRVEDIKSLSVVAFRNASTYLGAAYKKATETTRSYREIGHQKWQYRMLFEGRADVIVSDLNIFRYFLQQVREEGNYRYASMEYRVHPVFAPTDYYLAIPDESLRKDFNEGLRYLKQTGRYEEIFSRYGVTPVLN